MNEPFKCRVCKQTNKSEKIIVKDLQTGTLDEFGYVVCPSCQTMQIVNPLNDKQLERYYSGGYYSFSGLNTDKKHLFRLNRIKDYVINRKWVWSAIEPKFKILRRIGAQMDWSILDVGCGSGEHFLMPLSHIGFKSLVGADPYIGQTEIKGNVKLVKGSIEDVAGYFDLITFHHSFEHVLDPHKVLLETRKKLKPDGFIIIRIPVFPSLAWRMYKENWYQIDAPRHIHLFSKKAMKNLCDQTGLLMSKVIYDSHYFQFEVSENYVAGIPMTDFKNHKIRVPFLRRKFLKLIVPFLNRMGLGDQAIFILKLKRDS